MSDDYFMAQALKCAQLAYEKNEVPVGAVLVHGDNIIAEGYNQSITQNDPCAHAEIIALREAAKVMGNYRLVDTTLYVTLEPCVMCVGAMVHARIQRLVFATTDPKTGAICSVLNLLDAEHFNHKIQWSHGIYAEESASFLQAFFRQRRKINNKKQSSYEESSH